jgi:pilus assembly protein Flp/PilA
LAARPTKARASATANRKIFRIEGANQMIKKFLRDETGLELSEYAVAAALVALAVITAFTTLGTNIGAKIGNLATKIAP